MPVRGIFHIGLDCSAQAEVDLARAFERAAKQRFDFLAVRLDTVCAGGGAPDRAKCGALIGIAPTSVEALAAALKQASALALRGVVLPALTTPDALGPPCWYANAVNRAMSSTIRDELTIALRVHVNSSGFLAWTRARALFDDKERLSVALEFPRNLTDSDEEFERWLSEPISFVIIPVEVFIENKQGYPVLPKKHKARLLRLFEKKITVIFTVSDGFVDVELSSHVNYVARLFETAPASTASVVAASSSSSPPLRQSSPTGCEKKCEEHPDSRQVAALPEPEEQPSVESCSPPPRIEVAAMLGGLRRKKATKKSASDKPLRRRDEKIVAEAADAGVAGEDDALQWAKYYRECADYYQQCALALGGTASMSAPQGAAAAVGSPGAFAPVAAAGPSASAPLPMPGCWPALSAAASVAPLRGSPFSNMPGSAHGPPAGIGKSVCGLSDADISQLITAWYSSGYITGHYAGRQGL